METVLKITDLTVGYGKEKTVLNGISLEIGRGEIFGLLGPNGAGKTTLIKSIIGLINIRSGSIEILGKPNFSPDAKARSGYMPEAANYYWFMTAREILRIFGALAGLKQAGLKDRIEYALETVGLAGEKKALVKTFSKGMQARLNIAQAILHDPEFLILDEPFSGLDPLGRIDIRNILKKKKDEGKTIFLSSHELSEAELICGRICVMGAGKLLKQGPIRELLGEKGEHSLENYFVKIITESK
ncbi:MAG: ABC transporter ATP-binding protein [Candidatus Omnitrophota bacterium]|nr:ABC transporter ATP-binding protein [Candidatus Omnitrophota bacterium]